MKSNIKPKKCHKCPQESKIRLVDKELCLACFCKAVEQKVKRGLRDYDLKKDMKVYLDGKGVQYIFKKLIHMPVEIVDSPDNAEKIIMPITLDDKNEKFLENLFNNSELKEPSDSQIIPLFVELSSNAISKYFEIKEIPYSTTKSDLANRLDKLELKYPGLKASLKKSNDKIQELLE